MPVQDHGSDVSPGNMRQCCAHFLILSTVLKLATLLPLSGPGCKSCPLAVPLDHYQSRSRCQNLKPPFPPFSIRVMNVGTLVLRLVHDMNMNMDMEGEMRAVQQQLTERLSAMAPALWPQQLSKRPRLANLANLKAECEIRTPMYLRPTWCR